MANTATSILIDTLDGTTTKQTGHPDFELPEAIGTSPCTIELWYQHGYTGWTDWSTLINITNTTAGTDNTTVSTAGSDFYLMAQYGSGNNYYEVYCYNTDGTTSTGVNSGTYNNGNIIRNTQWNHVAFVRNTNGFSGLYHNGVLIGGGLGTSNHVSANSIAGKRVELGFNRVDSANYMFTGYMDEIRISKKARYGNFDTPTAPLSSSQTAGPGVNTLKPENVIFLLQANNTTTTSDTIYERTGHGVITVSGTLPYSQTQTLPWASTALGPFTTSNYLRYTDFDAEDFTWPGDWSVEAWLYQTADGTEGKYATILHLGDSDGSPYQFYWACHNSNNVSNHIYIHDGTNDSSISETSRGVAVPLNQWTHIAICRNNFILSYHINGQLHNFRVDDSPATGIRSSMTHLSIGFGFNTTDHAEFPGYIDNLRICKDVAAYTPHFNPYGSQKNVVHNRGGALTDARLASANTHAIQMGRAAIGSDAATNANTYCLDFDGTADYLLSYNGLPDDTSGSFFAWVYLDVTPDNNDTIYWSNRRSGATYYWRVEVNANGKFGVEQRANDTVTAVEGPVVSTGAWHSIGVTSDGTSYVFHLDGTASTGTATSGTDNGDWYGDSASQDMQAIGVYHATNGTEIGGYFNGKIMQVGLWSGTFSNTVMAALHSAGKSADLTVASGVYTATEIGTQRAYWRMGNHRLDTAKTIYDASGNGYDMHEVSDPAALTYTTGTTFENNWQHRGYFTPDQYTSLLIQSSTNEGATSFQDTGPGFKRIQFDGTDDVAIVSSLGSYRSSDSQGSLNLWVKPATGGAFQTMLLVTDSASTSYYLNFRISSGNKLQLVVQWDGSNSVVFEQSGTVSFGAWHMYTITCDTNGYKLYIDGSEDTSAVMTTEYGDNNWWFNDFTSTKANRISLGAGAYSSTMHYFTGLMSQVGIWGGSSGTTGVLSASEISAIYDLGPDGNVKTSYSTGLVDYWTFGNQIGEGTDTASTIYSQVTSGNDLTTSGTMAAPFAGHTITRTNVNHTTDKSVFGGSSIHFDGTDDYLSIPASHEWNFGSGEATIEFWINPQDATSQQRIVSSQGSSFLFIIWYGRTDNKFSFRTTNAAETATTNEFDTGNWYHVAVTKVERVFKLYVDGIEELSVTATGDAAYSDALLMIGAYHDGTEDLNAYLDEIRISQGIARYKKSIERFANTFVAKGDTGDAFTTLQIQSNGAKNGTGYSLGLNSTGNAIEAGSTVTVTGNVKWSNFIGNPYGGANTCLHFPARSDYIRFSDVSAYDSGSQDLTVEMWFWYDQTPGTVDRANMFGTSNSTGSDNTSSLPFIGFRGSGDSPAGVLQTSIYRGSTTVFSRTKSRPSHREWHHIVAQVNGSVFEAYLDGVLQEASAISGSSPAMDQTVGLGISGNYSSSGNAEEFKGFIDGFRLSIGIARYGGIQLRTTQQTHVSANSDSGVITSNSTFGSANNIFSTDGQTTFLLTGDELYSNTHVTASGNKFLMSVGDTNVSNVTSFITVTVANGMRRDGATGQPIYYFDGFGRAPLTLVRDNHYQFYISDSDYSSHPLKFSTTAGGTHGGGTEYTTGVTVDTDTYSGTNYTLIKFSPTSATPDSLHYYCSSHNNMGHTISVTDSTGSDGVIAPRPVGITKGDGTTSSSFPTQRQGVSAYGANSYYFDGADFLKTPNIPDLFTPHQNGTRDDFTMEIWYYQTSTSGTWQDLFVMKGYWNSGDGLAMYVESGKPRPYYNQAGSATEILDAGVYPLNIWHHYAVQSKNGTFEVYLNGVLRGVKNYGTAIFDDETNAMLYIGARDNASPVGFPFYGYVDEPRFSKGIARYGFSGTNVKLGTNAVHHSHCRLLITSNTFDGNTHFDDFSDQGNYWNQQPLSYYFDGTDDKITTPSLTHGTTFAAAAWVRPTHTGDDGGIFAIDNSTYALYHNTALVPVHGNSPGDSAFDSGYPMVEGNWHLMVATKSGATSKMYVDGVEVSSLSSGTTAHDGVHYIGNLTSSGTYFYEGDIAQVCSWAGVAYGGLSDANIQAMWEAGPTDNWLTNYSDNMVVYYGMGNHNDVGGRPADNASTVYDRSGNGKDGTTAGTMAAPKKGAAIKAYGTVKHSTARKHKGSSAIFFDGDSDYLEMKYNALGQGSTTCDLTVEAWVAWFGHTGSPAGPSLIVTSTQYDNDNEWYIRLDVNGNLMFHSDSLSATLCQTTRGYDIITDTPGTWHHVVGQRRTTKVELYVDGILLADSGTTSTGFTAGSDRDMVFGKREWSSGTGSGQYWHGYMDEMAYYHGAAKYTPVATGLGTSTITPSYLPDPTGNHFTPSGLAITDQMLDSPENNFCTWNPLHPDTFTLEEGNTRAYGDGGWTNVSATFLLKTGKWYWEAKHTNNTASGTGVHSIPAEGNSGNGYLLKPDTVPLSAQSWNASGSPYSTGTNGLGIEETGWYYNFGVGVDTVNPGGTSKFWGDNEVIGFGLDLDNYKFFIYRESGNVVEIDINSTHTGNWILEKAQYYTKAESTYAIFLHENFGQGDPDGENNFTDSNGRGSFRREPPQGFLSWCTANMKDAEYAPIGPNTAAGTPDKHFDTLLYTGTAKSGTIIGGLNFQPDFVWIKNRGNDYHHAIYDSVRGANKGWVISDDANEVTSTAQLMSFNSDGFTLGDNSDSGNYVNLSANTYVAWCWKAGNETTVNSEGTVIVNTSVNQDAGFSIITGTTINVEANDMTETFGHGLNTTPEFLLFRNLEHPSGTQPARAFFPPLTTTNLKGLALSTAALFTNGTFKTFEINGNLIGIGKEAVEHNGDRFVCYAWHSVEGYSKFGSYEGNGNADGTFVYLGFKPAWIMIKNADATGNWQILDNKRNPTNPANDFVRANGYAAEVSNYDVDFLSNGIKLRNTDQDYNTAHTFFYMAFAEMPFKYATAR